MMSCRCFWMLKQWQRCWVSPRPQLTSWCMKQISPPWKSATGWLSRRSSSSPGYRSIQKEGFSEASEVDKTRSHQKLFSSTKWSVPARSVTRRAGSVFLSAFLWGQKYLSVLAQFQNHRESHWNEHQHSKKVCTDAGRAKTHHHGANQYHHKGQSKAKWKSSLHPPPYPGSSGAILSAAVGKYIPGYTEGESIRYERQAGTPCVTGCVRLCEVFPVEVGKQYPNSQQRRFGPILRQLEGSAFYRSAENKKAFIVL